MKLILMRHGESQGNVKHGFISGRTDPLGLTTNGRAQVIRTAWELKDKKVDHLLASPVVRAQETAGIIGTFIDKKPVTTEWLTELNHGVFEGFYWWEVIHKISPTWRKNRTQFHTSFPEGDSMEMLIHRVWTGLNEMIAEADNDATVMIVSHQAPISAIRYCLEHGDPKSISTPEKEEEFLKFMNTVQLPNAVFVEAVYDDASLKSMNEKISFEPLKPTSISILFYMKGLAEMSPNTKAEQLETASHNNVYQVTDTEKFIVKVLEGTDSAAAQRQVKVYEYLGTHDIAVPHIKYFDTSKSFYSADVLVQDFVEGEESKTCIQIHANQSNTFLEDIYEILRKIHAIPASDVESFWKPPVEKPFLSWKNFMHSNINLTLHSLQDFDLSEEIKKNVEHELSDLRESILSDTCSLVPIHSDPGSGNFIIGHEDGTCRLKSIIDFEWARIGDALWDFAYYWGWLERDNMVVAREWKKILEKYLPEEMVRLNQFRLLFHGWTVRDIQDYKDQPIRLRRGKKSLSLLA
ncbi:hypothetical protein BH09PAT2_BH09PAT2_10170 [soil metagenome]